MRTGLFLHFQMLAQYNRVANERMYERCSYLEAAEYLKQRKGSFGSIHGLLNHLLLADRYGWRALKAKGNKLHLSIRFCSMILRICGLPGKKRTSESKNTSSSCLPTLWTDHFITRTL